MACQHPVHYEHLEEPAGAYLVLCSEACGWSIGPGSAEWARELVGRINGFRDRRGLDARQTARESRQVRRS